MGHKEVIKMLHNHGTVKYKLIKNILTFNKTAMEIFGVEELTEDELQRMTINDLRNVEVELRIQTGLGRNLNYRKS